MYLKTFIFSFSIILSTLTAAEKTITTDELAYWDKIKYELINADPNANLDRIDSYLANAQKAFADASYAKSGFFKGSLGPISANILKCFFPKFKPEPNLENDPYSEKLAESIGKLYFERFKNEQAGMHPVVIGEKKDGWKGKIPFIGTEYLTMKPWYMTSVDQFRLKQPLSPNDPFWQDQLGQTIEKMKQVTDNEMKIILFWASSDQPGKNDFRVIADKYMEENHVDLAKRLEVRAILASVCLDAMIANYDSKYAYMVRRPFEIDPELKTFIPTPNHPSYPAGHAVHSSTGAAILSYYFPENKTEWDRLATECGQSRIWAGVHFPIDIKVGNELGHTVAEWGLKHKKS